MRKTRTTVESKAFAVTVEAVTPVDAPVEQAWQVLSDTTAYGSWNPFVRRLDGPLVSRRAHRSRPSARGPQAPEDEAPRGKGRAGKVL